LSVRARAAGEGDVPSSAGSLAARDGKLALGSVTARQCGMGRVDDAMAGRILDGPFS
jgi:hypothetical protein